MHEVKSALLPEIISYGEWTKGEAQKNSNHMLSEITASVTQHMHAQTWSIILSLLKTTPSCLSLQSFLKSQSLFGQWKLLFSMLHWSGALERQEEPLTLRSQFTLILQFPHTHNEGDQREILFPFFNFFPAPRPRRSDMSIMPVFLCPHKNRGNAKKAHCWQLLPADLLKRCDDHEWKHYEVYACKMKAAGKTNTSEVSLISQLFLLNVIKHRAPILHSALHSHLCIWQMILVQSDLHSTGLLQVLFR